MAETPQPIHNELHRIAITGIIWRKDADGRIRYLLTKRAPTKKAWPNRWTVPGGGLEVGDYMNTEATYQNTESPQWYGAVENTLRREVREEVGLEISDVQYLLDLAFIRPDGIPVIVLSYYARYESGEVVLDEDSVDHAWAMLDELPKYELISGIDHEIALVEERLKQIHKSDLCI